MDVRVSQAQDVHCLVNFNNKNVHFICFNNSIIIIYIIFKSLINLYFKCIYFIYLFSAMTALLFDYCIWLRKFKETIGSTP